MALVGIALVLAGVLGYVFAIQRLPQWPGIRNYAVPNWILIVAGLAVSVWAGARSRGGWRLLVAVLSGLNVVLAGFFGAALYVFSAVPPTDGPRLGAAAPDFVLPDQSGNSVRLADFHGRPLLLVFYRGHW
jgi:hypothetical protein